jgi:hypothetical protein
MRLAVKNWTEFQHYKDRSPPWIKLHRTLLDNLQYHQLSSDAAKWLPLIWLLGSEKNGELPDPDRIAFRLRITVEEVRDILEELEASQFLEWAGDEATDPGAGWGSRYISKAVKEAVFARDGGVCQHCGSGERIEYDHIVPVSSGGSGEESNVQLLCAPCNRRKRTKPNEAAEQVATQTENVAQPRGEERKEEGEVSKGRGKGARARKTQIPKDFKATPEQLEYARAQGCVDPTDTAERFYLHHAGKGTLHADWDLAFKYWCRNEKNFIKTGSGPIRPRMQTMTPNAPEDWDWKLKWHREKGMWNPSWGPEPGEPGCFVPKEFLQ